MKTNTFKALAVLALLTLATSAFAADPTPRPTPSLKATVNGYSYDASQAVTVADSSDVTSTFTYTAAGGAMALNATLGLAKLPKGAVIEEWYLNIPVQGTAAVASLGIQESAAIFLTTSTCPAVGCVASPVNNPNGLTANALPVTISNDTYLVLTTTTAATTPNTTPGTIKGWVRYHMHGGGTF